MSAPAPKPTTPVEQVGLIKGEVQLVETWFKAHEKLILGLAFIAAVFFMGNKFLDTVATRDRAAATQAAQVLTQQQTVNTTLAAQIAATQKQYQDLVVQLTQQNAVLQTQMAQRQVVYTQQVKTDASLPMPDLGNRWAQLAALKVSDISANTAGITVTPQGALDTVTQLEKVPELTSNVSDLTTEKNNLSDLVDSSDALNGQLTDQVKGLQSAAVDQDKVCKAEITSAKADARKGKLKWFLYGLGAGAGVTAGFVLHALL